MKKNSLDTEIRRMRAESTSRRPLADHDPFDPGRVAPGFGVWPRYRGLRKRNSMSRVGASRLPTRRRRGSGPANCGGEWLDTGGQWPRAPLYRGIINNRKCPSSREGLEVAPVITPGEPSPRMSAVCGKPSGLNMKPRHLLVMVLISGFLLPLSQVVLSMPVLKGHDLSYYEKGENHNPDDFSPIMISSNCGQGPPAGQVGQQDLTPLLIAWRASILLP